MTGVVERNEADIGAAVARVRTLEELGAVLRRLRRRHARRNNTSALTMRELARRSGYAYGVISEYLNGKTLPPTDRFDVLVRLLGASPAEQRAMATARDRVEEQRRERRNAPDVPRELPPDVFGFIGREAELAVLDRTLTPHRASSGDQQPAMPIAVLTGTAGVGKTALAIRWAHRSVAGFPDGCLYVDLRGYDPEAPVPPTQALAGFLRSLGVYGADLPASETERSARYRTLLAQRRVLVVLDNARDSEQVRPLLPGGSGNGTLVTSRDLLTGLTARHGAHRIDVRPLEAEAAVHLLHVLLGNRVTDEPGAAGDLAQRCAHLPLMLRLVAELVRTRPSATLAELAAELADVHHRLDSLDVPGEPRTACRAVFSWSYDSLAAPTARAFRLFGLHPGHDIDVYTVAALAGTDLAGAQALVDDLYRAHLVQPVRAGRYTMHDLLRAYAAELAESDPLPQRRAALGRVADQQLYGCSLAMELIAPFDHHRGRKQADPGWPVPPLVDAAAAVAWLDIERANLIAVAIHPNEDGAARAAHAAKLARILVRYLDINAHHQDAEVLYGLGTEAPDPIDQSSALCFLGTVCWRLGRYREAAAHMERSRMLARAADDDAVLGRALLSLGIIYWHLGRTTDTLHSGQEALALYRRIGDRLNQARVLGNLGTVYEQLGDFTAALEHHHSSLELFRDVGDPAGTSNELCGLGSALHTLGRHDEARERLEAALSEAVRIGYRECETEIHSHLGNVLLATGQVREAQREQQCALDLVRKTGDRTYEGYALGRLGTVHERLVEYGEALAHEHRALAVAKAIGDAHLAAEVRNRLGDTLRAMGRPRRALHAHRRALMLASGTGNRYQCARAHDGIARALRAIGAHRPARSHGISALTLYTSMGLIEADRVRAELDQQGMRVAR